MLNSSNVCWNFFYLAPSRRTNAHANRTSDVLLDAKALPTVRVPRSCPVWWSMWYWRLLPFNSRAPTENKDRSRFREMSYPQTPNDAIQQRRFLYLIMITYFYTWYSYLPCAEIGLLPDTGVTPSWGGLVYQFKGIISLYLSRLLEERRNCIRGQCEGRGMVGGLELGHAIMVLGQPDNANGFVTFPSLILQDLPASSLADTVRV